MAWLLFLDESGHDHRQMPYEVHGGVALQDAQLGHSLELSNNWK